MCCSGFLKMMMFIFNGGIFVAGAAILGVGIWVTVDSDSLLGILDNVPNVDGLSQLANVSYLLMGVGGVLLVIGFLGCCGAIRESRCMLLTFFSIVLIIFLIEVAGAIVLLVFQDLADTVLGSLEDEVQQDIRKNYGSDDSVTSLWNATMEQFKCCGYRNYTDFYDSPYYKNNRNTYPTMCCNANSTETSCNDDLADYSAVGGCYDKLLLFIEENATIVAAVALGVAALEIAAMVVSMILYKDIGNKA